MLSIALFVLSLAVSPAAAPTAAPAATPTIASELRPIAWSDEPRTRARVEAPVASAASELREPFAKTRAPVVQGPRPAAAPAPKREPTTLREPFSRR